MQKIKMWDGFIRFFHWSLVLLIAVLYFSGEEGMMALHFIAGYSVLALLVARLIWGIVGSDTAKLSSLIHSPKAALATIKSSKVSTGHNPAGSYMVLTFFVLLAIQVISGLMTTDDVLTDGPLVSYVSSSWVELASSLHHLNFDLLLFAIGFHVMAIILYRIKGVNLVKPMITGFSVESGVKQTLLRTGWLGMAIFIAVLSIVLWFWGGEPLQTLFND